MNIIKIKHSSEIPENYTGIVESENGTKYWLKNDLFHREDGPAIVYKNGSEEWYENGRYHRKNGPVIISNLGYKEWALDGVKIWKSERNKLDLRDKIILSKERHSMYPTVQVWKYIDENGIKEQIVIPGMEPWFIE